MPIRILIADDHAVVRAGLRALLLAYPELEVVGEAKDGTEALQRAESLRPNLVMLDISMPPENGIETAKRLKERYPELVVLFLTMHEDESLLHEALLVGAGGYVIKRSEDVEIIQAIHAASQGDLYVHPAMIHALLQKPVTEERRRNTSEDSLTYRELEVLHLLAKGNTNRQIAALLNLSTRTVENHRANLLGKLGMVSRVELVNYAEEHCLFQSSCK